MPRQRFVEGALYQMAGAAIVKLIETEKVTLGAGVPTIWQGMLAHLRAHGGDISSLRTLVCGGSALPEAVERLRAMRVLNPSAEPPIALSAAAV